MGEQDVVARLERLLVTKLDARRVLAGDVALPGELPRLVYGHPVLDAVAQLDADGVDVCLEVVDYSPPEPAAAVVLERLWEVEVVEGDEGGDARV